MPVVEPAPVVTVSASPAFVTNQPRELSGSTAPPLAPHANAALIAVPAPEPFELNVTVVAVPPVRA